jgi:AcrR family transcriptional regulator
MPDKSKALEPQQARSRESLRRLLRAAAEVLGQLGIAGATIPRIAAHAGLTPGAVYRRFRNKEVLLETMILQILEDQDRLIRQSITPAMAAVIPIEALAEQVISSLLISYRRNAGLLRAIRQFSQDREGTAFWRKATRLQVRSVEYIVDLLIASKGQIRHSNPKAAIGVGVAMIVGALWELVVYSKNASVWKGLVPVNDKELQKELTRSLLSYLTTTELTDIG